MTDLREAMARHMAAQFERTTDDGGHIIWSMLSPRRQQRWRDEAGAALAAIGAAGFAVVPREPTEEMVEAGMAARQMPGQASGVFGQTIDSSWRHEFQYELRIWAAMLDAAPKP